MNYVDLSGIYSIQSVADVFGDKIINPPDFLILDSNSRPSSSLVEFS